MESVATRQPSVEPVSENFNHIELTPEELEAALQAAKSAKHYRLVKEAYFKGLDEPRTVADPTRAEWIQAAQAKLDMDQWNQTIIETMCGYFSGEGLDVKKGLLLVGPVGAGKSHLMRFFKFNAKQSYRVISARKIENDYSSTEGGEDVIEFYSTDRTIDPHTNIFGSRSLSLCIDDLGTEMEGRHFGKSRNVLAEVIQNRYDAGLVTHITANLDRAGLETAYGSRVVDRLREMVHLVEFKPDTPSRRK